MSNRKNRKNDFAAEKARAGLDQLIERINKDPHRTAFQNLLLRQVSGHGSLVEYANSGLTAGRVVVRGHYDNLDFEQSHASRAGKRSKTTEF